MSEDANTPVGWRIAEALRRCVDRSLLTDWFSNRRAWIADGRRTRFFYRSEYVEGYDATRHNEVERASHHLLDRDKASYQKLINSLANQLKQGRLTAWGRRESPINPPTLIPAIAWEYLVISSVRKSIVRERNLAKTEIYDVRIVPYDRTSNSVKTPEKPSFVPVKERISAIKVVGTIGSRTTCFTWLRDLMSESIDKKPKPKQDYWAEARKKWPNTLTERSFERAWSDAVAETKAFAWSSPGRMPKSPQTKSTHQ